MDPANREQEAGQTPPLSVVVIGRNEGERLMRCLRSIRAADWPADRLELIYVDSDSTDDSVARAAELGAQVVKIRPSFPSAAAARNAGLAQASHALVQFLDGDTQLDRDWLRRAVAAFEDPKVVAVFGQRRELEPTRNVYHYWTHHDWASQPGPAGHCGGDSMFRREALQRAGGYDSSLIAGEERDLACRLLRAGDCLLLCLDAPMTLHEIGITRFSQYWKRCSRSGYAYAEVSGRYPELESWRHTVRRNLALAAISLGFGLAALGLRSFWPLAVWLAFVAFAIVRDALRVRARVGSLGGALLVAMHHYLSKVPTLFGHLDYYLSRALGRRRRLIEYRGG
jgi:cellulose synthase/poly-beta-1,6-N-acetylglucosamine synthase-like glycosyltransferase